MLKNITKTTKSILSLILLPFLLSGCMEGYCFFLCYEGLPVQTAYAERRDQCQLLAERKIILYEDPQHPPPPKERNTILLALFSECMHGKDWGVTAPKREGVGGSSGARVRVRQAEPAVPDIAEDDIVITSGNDEGRAGRVVLPDRLYADPDREVPRNVKPRSGPLVGQGIGPGYDEGPTEDYYEPEYYGR